MRNIPVIIFILFSCLLNSFAQTTTSSAVPTPTPSPETGARNESSPSNPSVSTPASTDAKPFTAKLNPEKPSPAYVVKNAPARIPRFETAPVIDGQLNDGIWQTAAVFGDFLQIQPGDNIAPSSPTEVMIGYDAKHLYIAFRVKQDPDKIRANVARRDNIFNDDYVGVYLDTFNDQRQAYAIFWNPLGIQADGTFSESNGEDYSVDLVMESKGVLTEDGFTIEAAIPFKSLRYEAGKDKQWGLHIYRRIKWNNNELDSWQRNNRSESGSLNKAGHITGLEDIATTRQIEIIPSFTLSQTSRRSQFTFDPSNTGGRFVNEGVRGDFGLTAKFSLTPTVTLDFAYNPDFAQVEADAPVTTANQRFPVFFPEKRPFFLERIDIFQTPMNVVHTRTIVDPDIAAKITGRRGKNTFGVMYASDNAPGNFDPDDREKIRLCQKDRTNPSVFCRNERIVDQNADIGVVRFKRDIGKENNLGFFASTYNFVDRHNHAGGLDGRFRFDKKTVAEFQLVGTTTRDFFYDADLDKTSYRTGNGIGYNVWIERSDRNLYMNYLAVGRSHDYRADVGFRQRTDTNYLGSFIQYKTDQDAKKTIIFKRIQNATNISYDWRRRVQYWITNTQGMLALQRQTFIGGAFQYGGERVYEDEFGPVRKFGRPGAFTGDDPQRSTVFKAVQAFIETTPNKKFFAFVLVDHTWGQMDYDLGANGQNNPGPGNQLFIESSFRYQLTTDFQTSLNYNKVRLVRNDTGRVAFDDNIFSSRTTYQFSRNVFARLRLDYSTISEKVRPQLVFGWTPSPGKALYIGYSDNFNYYSRNPYNGVPEQGLHSNGRTFFIKMSYLFRKSF